MRVITPENRSHVFYKLDDVKNAIFLAGPCPRDPKEKDEWREEAITALEELKFDGVVLNPTNPYYDETDPDHLSKQTAWEWEAMNKASAIVFWIERTEAHPAYTTNIEFGNWYDKDGTYFGWTDKALKNRYLQERLNMIDKKRYKTIKSMMSAVVKDLNRKPQKWFLSDTHFSQERTLELSHRPFRNIQEMDFALISNWNKHITVNDTVYFLGDFGERFEYLNLLNFKELHFVLGNYERKDKDGNDITKQSVKTLSKIQGVTVYENRGDCRVKLKNKQEVVCIHEPICPANEKDYTDFSEETCLYGHIHGRTYYKSNGTDCGVDINGFAPLSEDDVLWRLNAIQFLDENVWRGTCV